jgi:uncharacterized glyoxalase superfamily protein PhnB
VRSAVSRNSPVLYADSCGIRSSLTSWSYTGNDRRSLQSHFFLSKIFGFTERARDARDDGTVRHAELLTGDGGVIMLGSPGAGFRGSAKLGEVTQLVCVTITDLPGHRDRARAAGAAVSEVGARANRARSYTVDDPEGHRWYFSEPL